MKARKNPSIQSPLQEGDGVWHGGLIWKVCEVELYDEENGPVVTIEHRRWIIGSGGIREPVRNRMHLWPLSPTHPKDWWKLFGDDMHTGRLKLSDRHRVVEWKAGENPCPRWLPHIFKDKKCPEIVRGTVVTPEDFPHLSVPLAVYIGSSKGGGINIDWSVPDYDLDAAEGFHFLT
jgi:hypothetical protein